MKRIRVFGALLGLLATLAFGVASSPGSAMEAGQKCTCAYTSGSLGVLENNDCVIKDCWVAIDSLE